MQLAAHGIPDVVFTHAGGIGDALLMSRVVQEWRSRRATKSTVWVVTHYPVIFERDPECANALPFADVTSRFLARLKAPVQCLHYTVRNEVTDRDTPPDRHILAEMCRIAGLCGEILLKPRIILTNRELVWGERARGAICIQSTTSNARYPISTKEWGSANLAAVVTRLVNDGHRVIQLGSAQDPSLGGAEDLRGRTTLRQTAALLASSRLFVGLVGGLMHLARAVDCPAVIVYGGRERPGQSGYSANINVVHQPACSPCWLWSRCEHHMMCMKRIEPAAVIAAIERALVWNSGPLPSDHVLV